MKLPRRVPWSSAAELEQIFSWIYTDESDVDSKTLAINRLSAWRAITALPHALESTLALLVAIKEDNIQQCTSYLSVRQSYASAIIRLVNGLVDPLQLGAYARSIASIASQMGLPSWLVELRHAATHEDLPSLELLREAANQSMAWLFHNYFLPMINSPSTSQSQAPPLRPVTPILKEYKALMKAMMRDASLKPRLKAEVASILKDFERWLTEARVAAKVTVGWDPTEQSETNFDGEEDSQERWALERLCNSLLEKGWLVPLSKKKRIFPPGTFHPPNSSIFLWSPLLKHLQNLYPEFAFVLCTRIVSALVSDYEATGDLDPTYNLCLARWAQWLVESMDFESQGDLELRKELTVDLLLGLGRDFSVTKSVQKAAIALVQSLNIRSTDLEELLQVLYISDRSILKNWNEGDIFVMTERLENLVSSLDFSTVESRPVVPLLPMQETSSNIIGWQMVDSSQWHPCPIGIYCL